MEKPKQKIDYLENGKYVHKDPEGAEEFADELAQAMVDGLNKHVRDEPSEEIE